VVNPVASVSLYHHSCSDCALPTSQFLNTEASNNEASQHLLAAFSYAYLDRLCRQRHDHQTEYESSSIKHTVLAIRSLTSTITSSSTTAVMSAPATLFAVAGFNWVAVGKSYTIPKTQGFDELLTSTYQRTRGELRESAIHTATLQRLLAPIVEAKTRAEIDAEYSPLLLQ
jgi:hypothetical protein